MGWMTAREALAALGVRPQSLYANVSRGRIRARADPDDPRRSLYNAADVRRMAARRAGRRKSALLAAETIHWGEPILPSAVSTVRDGRLFYRGRDAATFAATASLEEAAALLWQVQEVKFDCGASADARRIVADPQGAAFAAVAARAATDLPMPGRASPMLKEEAASLVGTFAGAMFGAAARADMALHRRVAAAWRRPKAGDIIRRALALLADHELNASTFAARVAASTGASLAACALAGLAALTGPRHGGAAAAVQSFAGLAAREGPADAARAWLSRGHAIPGFGHELYPDGDARAAALIAEFEPPAGFVALRRTVERMTGEAANIDFVLAAMAAAFDLPRHAPLTLFMLARPVGWIAHALEQNESGELIRPRARYVGAPIT